VLGLWLMLFGTSLFACKLLTDQNSESNSIFQGWTSNNGQFSLFIVLLIILSCIRYEIKCGYVYETEPNSSVSGISAGSQSCDAFSAFSASYGICECELGDGHLKIPTKICCDSVAAFLQNGCDGQAEPERVARVSFLFPAPLTPELHTRTPQLRKAAR
jgi:hypothetical protein